MSSASASLYVVSEPAIDVHTSASGKNYSMFAAPSVTSLDHGGVRLPWGRGAEPVQIVDTRKGVEVSGGSSMRRPLLA